MLLLTTIHIKTQGLSLKMFTNNSNTTYMLPNGAIAFPHKSIALDYDLGNSKFTLIKGKASAPQFLNIRLTIQNRGDAITMVEAILQGINAQGQNTSYTSRLGIYSSRLNPTMNAIVLTVNANDTIDITELDT